MYKNQFKFVKKLANECYTDQGRIDLSNFTIRGRDYPFLSFYPPYTVVYKPVFFKEPTYHPNLVSYWKHRKHNTFFINLVKIDDHDKGLIYFDEPIHQVSNNKNQNINVSMGYKLINIEWLINDNRLRSELVREIEKVVDNNSFDNRMCSEDDHIVLPINYDGNGTLLYSKTNEKIYCFDVLAPRRIKKSLSYMAWTIVERDQEELKILFLTKVTYKQIQECIEYNIAEQAGANGRFSEKVDRISYKTIKIYGEDGKEIPWRCIDSYEIYDYQNKLYTHPLISDNRIQTIEQLRIFMEHHVFAVWDFMSILKYLQNKICPTSIPWVPNKYTKNGLARLINEIVVAEESDSNIDGCYMSHFEIYIEAMKEIGADTYPITNFIEMVKSKGIVAGLDWLSKTNPVASRFTNSTMQLLEKESVSAVASSFTYGRETSIPNMFYGIINNLNLDEKDCPMFYYYMNRHIELDGDEHGPASLVLVNVLTNFENDEIIRAVDEAFNAIDNRMLFWDGIYDKIK